MRWPRMTTRQWMVATALVAVLCWDLVRAQAFQRRAAFHAREKQSYLQNARAWEIEYRRLEESRHTWCGPLDVFVATQEIYEATPEWRERASYHARLEAMYRRAARSPWVLAPSETPFVPDDRGRSPKWLRAKAETYRTLEATRRRWAEDDEKRGDLAAAKEDFRQAEEDARKAADYERRAEQARRSRSDPALISPRHRGGRESARGDRAGDFS